MTQVYGWQGPYEEAMLETKRIRLPNLIQTAQAAIDARLAQLGSDLYDCHEERQALADAQAGLRVLSREVPQS